MDDVGSQAGRAAGWSFLNTAVARFGTLALGIVLARVLGPEEFGTFAIAFIALMAVLSFNELGVSLAVVRWRDDPAEIAPTVNAISVGMSAVLTVVMILLAPAFTRAMGDPGATLLVQLLSLVVLINGLVATPAAVMQRLFRQDQRMIADQVNVWVGAFVSVGLALSGMDAMSLVIGRLSGAGLSALLFLRFSPLPYRMALDRRFVRPLLAFGLPLAGASIVVFLVGFVDQLIVGHVLSPVQLGFYVLAANLASWPVTMFSQPLRSVAPAMFARLQGDPQRLHAGLLNVTRPLSAVALPVCVAIAALSSDIVEFVYGSQWAPAAGVLKWLALLAALRIFFELGYDFLVVLGRSRAILIIQVVWILALVPALWFAVHRAGIEGAAMTVVVVSLVVSAPMYLIEFHRAGQSLRSLVVSLRLPVLFSGVMAALLVGLDRVAAAALPTLVIGGLTALGFCAVLLWFVRADLRVFRKQRS